MSDVLTQNEVMSDSALREALAKALEKLPNMLEQYTMLEKRLNFVTTVLDDKASLQYLMEQLAKDLPEITFNKETMQAIATMINKLPKLAQYVEQAESFLGFGQAVLSDKESLLYMAKGVENLTAPIQHRIKQGASILEETKRRAQKDKAPVTVFTLVKMLKDPSVQSGLQYVRALLAVIGEQKGKPSH